MTTVDLLDEETGEVTTVDPAEVASEYAHHDTLWRAACREIDELMDARQRHGMRRDHLAAMLTDNAPQGTIWDVDGATVAVVSGKRRNATVDRDGIDRHREALVDLGLVEIVEQPPPPPKVKPVSVSRFRAAEVDLARAGVPLTDVVRESGPGELTVVVKEADDE